MDTVLERMRSATCEELLAVAKALDFEVEQVATRLGITPVSDPGAVAVLVAERFTSVCKDWSFKETLTHVATAAADEAKWSPPKLVDETQPEWVEEYIYRALCFAHLSEHKTMPKEEAAVLENEAKAVLGGRQPSAEELVREWASNAAVALGIGVSLLAGPWAVAGLGAAAVVGWLVSPSMKKLVPATFLLIHARKRREFETVLAAEEAGNDPV